MLSKAAFALEEDVERGASGCFPKGVFGVVRFLALCLDGFAEKDGRIGVLSF